MKTLQDYIFKVDSVHSGSSKHTFYFTEAGEVFDNYWSMAVPSRKSSAIYWGEWMWNQDKNCVYMRRHDRGQPASDFNLLESVSATVAYNSWIAERIVT